VRRHPGNHLRAGGGGGGGARGGARGGVHDGAAAAVLPRLDTAVARPREWLQLYEERCTLGAACVQPRRRTPVVARKVRARDVEACARDSGPKIVT
jgi:hypothetical protein